MFAYKVHFSGENQPFYSLGQVFLVRQLLNQEGAERGSGSMRGCSVLGVSSPPKCLPAKYTKLVFKGTQ